MHNLDRDTRLACSATLWQTWHQISDLFVASEHNDVYYDNDQLVENYSELWIGYLFW